MCNVLLVKKPELVPGKFRGWRFTIDYREVNRRVIGQSSYPIPGIDEVIARLGNRKVFTSLDICDAYWRAPISNESRKFTGFIVNAGHMQGCYSLLSHPLKSSKFYFERHSCDRNVCMSGQLCRRASAARRRSSPKSSATVFIISRTMVHSGTLMIYLVAFIVTFASVFERKISEKATVS